MNPTHTENLGFQVSDAPTPVYEDIQTTIVIIKSNYLIIRVQHIVVTVNFLHEQYAILTIYTAKLNIKKP